VKANRFSVRVWPLPHIAGASVALQPGDGSRKGRPFPFLTLLIRYGVVLCKPSPDPAPFTLGQVHSLRAFLIQRFNPPVPFAFCVALAGRLRLLFTISPAVAVSLAGPWQ